MKKQIAIFTLWVSLFGLIPTAFAQNNTYDYTIKKYKDGWWFEMKELETRSSEKPSGAAQLLGYSEAGKTFVLLITISKIDQDCPEALISEQARQAPQGVMQPSSFSISLVNGETFQADASSVDIIDHRNDQYKGSDWVGVFQVIFSCDNFLRSNFKELAGMDTNTRHQYVTSRLAKYNIASIQINGYTFSFDRFHSATTLKSMFNKAAELSGDKSSYTYVETPDAGTSTPLANTSPSNNTPSSTPSAKFFSISANYNIVQDGQKGMEVEVILTTNNLTHKKLNIAAYFYFEDGTALKDYNQRYYNTAGNVAVSKDYTPDNNKVAVILRLFIPYSEFHLASGKHKLKTYAVTWDDHNQELIRSDWYHFWVEQP